MNASTALTRQHRNCDKSFAECEALARKASWDSLQTRFADYASELERHLTLEEHVLFPAFEEATGMVHGPTEVMRMEHAEMRELLTEMRTAADTEQGDAFLELADTLLILNQQHNMKEENMLYPMCQAHVPDVDTLVSGESPA